MSDRSADDSPHGAATTAAEDRAPTPVADRLSFPEVVRLIEDRKQVNLAEDETERPKFLRALRDGAFPAPVEPRTKLPREKTGGDVDWSECYWSAKDIEAWLSGRQSAKDWEESWDAHKIKRYRDLPALASYTARRIIRGDYEWEHWQDHYQPRAYTGKAMWWTFWSIIVGVVCFGFLMPLRDPLFQRDADGNFVYVGENVVEYRDAETNRLAWAIRVDADDRGRGGGYFDYEKAYRSLDSEGAVVIRESPVFSGLEPIDESRLITTTNDAGQRVPQPARLLEFRTNRDGHFVRKDADGSEKVIDTRFGPQVYIQGEREYSFFRFLAADLSGVTGIGFMSVPMAIFLLFAVVPFLFSVMRFMHSWLSLQYTLTDSRLKVREGLVHRRWHQVRVIQIQDLSVEQGPIQRVMGVGNVKVSAPDDADTPEYQIRGVRDPRAVKDRIFTVSEAAKSEKRYYIESSGPASGGRLAGR